MLDVAQRKVDVRCGTEEGGLLDVAQRKVDVRCGTLTIGLS